MTVILRALLVVGVMTYFAAQQRPGESSTAGQVQRPRIETTTLTAAWGSLSSGAREQIAREGTAEITRRLSTAKLSQDTLLSSDRRPPWRGGIE